MNVLAWILGVALVAVFAAAGITKLIDIDRSRERFGYSRGQYRLLGLAEVAAPAGILVGLLARQWEWLAVTAAVGICSLMLGALMTHARVGDDAKQTLPAAVMFVAAIVFIIAITLR